jgi:prepilin-type N-terminal cleavage/methylation domain-containing protein
MKRKLRRAAAGFTLVELMVTLAIAAVLMMVAVPSYQSYARNAAVAQVSGNFFNATQLARANAMRLSRHTLVQVVDANQGWVGGWRVYADIDRDMQYTAGTDNLIGELGPAGEGVMSNGPSGDKLENRGTVAEGYVLFNPAGFPRSSTDGIATGSVVFYLPQGRATAVVYSQSGRFRRCDPTKNGCRPDPSAP